MARGEELTVTRTESHRSDSAETFAAFFSEAFLGILRSFHSQCALAIFGPFSEAFVVFLVISEPFAVVTFWPNQSHFRKSVSGSCMIWLV